MSIPDTKVTNLQMALELGVTESEFKHVEKALGRCPSWAELGVFSAMYSEHCSYKSSKHALKRFPTEGPQVLQGPGENAGIVDIGHGWAIAFKMESHNHPSFIEPYQGAATGVGGILRDVFTMGARPIASMNSLCFGDLSSAKSRSVVKGVVKGIGDYGNSVGVPTVAGQTFFHPCYNGNPLVNAFTLGIVRHDSIFKGYASGVGNLVVYAGAKTGRDGVHGATMASKEFSTEEEPDRPTVQVGDPFTEKLLLEATLEVMKKELVVGIQDMGAAGITSSSFEMAHRAGTGLKVDLDKVPTREKNMSAYELLLSESQERMLMVVTPDKLEAVKAVYEKWDLHAEVIGEVVAGDRVQMFRHKELVLDIPVELVVIPPKADRPKVAAGPKIEEIDPSALAKIPLEKKIQSLLEAPTFAHPGPLVEQYDSMVGNRTRGTAFDDAAVIRLREVKEASLALALTVDCNPRVVKLAPREGGKRAVAECAINLACRGATPLAITDCLNFGSPENPQVMWEFEESIEGMSEACRELNTPVISGNVSFYNDTDGSPIYPTPMIGMAGLIEEEFTLPASTLQKKNWTIAILGEPCASLGGSLFAYQALGRDLGTPANTDLQTVKATVAALKKLARLPIALHDISDGGLITAALEMWLHGSDSVAVEIECPEKLDEFLFGENIPRVLVAYPADSQEDVLKATAGLQLTPIGKTVAGESFKILQENNTLWTTRREEIQPRWRDRWKPLFE